MTLGAEPKKIAILAVIVVGGLIYYVSSSWDSSPSPAPRAVSTDVTNTSSTATPAASVSAKARNVGRGAVSEFRPRVLGTRPDDKTDPASIDPELRLDLLAKVQAVGPVEAGRNLFQFGVAPPPDKPMPGIPTNVPKIAVNQPPAHPPAVVPSGPPAPPPPPPINLKYYGYTVSKADGHKQAFLLDGEEPLIVIEGQTVKQRYKIVKIALTSIDIEDTQAKDTQTLKLQDVPG